jgi:hypothetical protein
MKDRRWLGLVLLMALGALPSQATNIVLNPSFELGSVDWTENTNLSAPWRITNNSLGRTVSMAQSGTWWAEGGCNASGHSSGSCVFDDIGGSNPRGDWLYQDLNTVIGATYSLSFWYASDGNNMELEALFGSTVAYDLTSVSDQSYHQYTSTATLTATSTLTRLVFLEYQGPQYASLDSIDVEQISSGPSTPEPASLSLIGFGLLVLYGISRNRRSSARMRGSLR